MSWLPIAPRIFRWTDTCNVYCVTSGDRGILIDAGSGDLVDHLEEIGVRQVEWVLHTHHHRDQSWGTPRLREHGAKVAVPEHERHLFDQAELFWQHKRVYDNYNDRNTFFALAENVPVDADLEDYETFTWRDVELEIIPAKGHTHGSSMLIGSIAGRSVAFTGDLLAAGGVLYQYHALEYNYGDQQGAFFTLQSLQALRRHAPDLALPSHGDLIEDPVGDCARLEDRLMTLARLGAGIRFMGRDGGHGLDILPDPRFTQVSRHLLWGGPHTCSNFYVLLSESGKACFIDYGHSHWAHMGTGSEREDGDTMRFVVHHLDELRETYGVHDIDLVLVTHIHDDHTAGIPYLVRHEERPRLGARRGGPGVGRPGRLVQHAVHARPSDSDRTPAHRRRTLYLGGIRLRGPPRTRPNRVPLSSRHPRRRAESCLHRRQRLLGACARHHR